MFAIRLLTGRGSPMGCYFCLLVFAVGLMGCMETINHDASSAGKKAEEFAQVVLVKQDVENGYGLLADGTKRYVSREQFKAVVSKLHPNAFPKTVTALEYEPMPGEKAIYVFLTGEKKDRPWLFRQLLVLRSTASVRSLDHLFRSFSAARAVGLWFSFGYGAVQQLAI